MGTEEALYQTGFRTDFLVASSSMLSGAGTVANLAGNFYEFNTAPLPEEADVAALRSDWGVTAQDVRVAVQEFRSAR
jgi:hypothetical protein